MNARTLPFIGKYRFGWISLLSLAIIFIIGLVTGLTESIRGLSTTWLIPLGLVAMVWGWFLGGAKHRTWVYFTSGILSGFVLLTFIQSGFAGYFFQAWYAALKISLLIRYPQPYLPNSAPLFYYLYSAIDRLWAYGSEISHWFLAISFRQAKFDPLSATLLWGSMLWVVVFLMAWLLRRKKHAFIAALPALFLLSAVIGYTRQSTTGLIISLAALLAIMVLIEHLQRENRWETNNIDYSEEIRFDIISISVPIITGIIIIASLIPRISLVNLWTRINHQSQTESARDLLESLGLDQAAQDSFISLSPSSMPRSHLIGSGPELSELMIMEIDTGETFLPPQIDPLTQRPTYYWFGRSYDIYTGSGWITSDIVQQTLPAFAVIHNTDNPYHRQVTHSIQKSSLAPQTLYFTGVVNSVNQPTTVAWYENSSAYFSAQLDTRKYQVISSIHSVTEEQLRQSDGSPPESILKAYVELPPELPKRVVELAMAIPGQAVTPYEKAKAIETYLRQFEYTLDLPSPPKDRDLVDYFLFDLKRGYCDYFASAMVILARVNGLPARLAVGYATGTYDYQRQVFIVSEANAHAWPEVFLDPFGWVPFEPTSSLSPPNWSAGTEIDLPAVPALPAEDNIVQTNPLWLIGFGVFILLILVFLSGYIWLSINSRGQKDLSTTAQIEVIYHKMRRHLTRLFFPLPTEHTHLEFLLAYTNHLQNLDAPGCVKTFAMPIINQITAISYLYEKGVYSPRKIPAYQVGFARRYLFTLQIQSVFLRTMLFFTKS